MHGTGWRNRWFKRKTTLGCLSSTFSISSAILGNPPSVLFFTFGWWPLVLLFLIWFTFNTVWDGNPQCTNMFLSEKYLEPVACPHRWSERHAGPHGWLRLLPARCLYQPCIFGFTIHDGGVLCWEQKWCRHRQRGHWNMMKYVLHSCRHETQKRQFPTAELSKPNRSWGKNCRQQPSTAATWSDWCLRLQIHLPSG